MALPYQVNFTVLDGQGKRSVGTFYVDSAQTVANAMTEAVGLLGNIEPMSIGQIENAQILLPLDLSGLVQAAPDVNANNGYKLRAILQSAEGHRAILTIPSGNITKVAANSENVIVSNPSDGYDLVTDIGVRPIVTSHDEAITTVTKFYEVHGR